METFLYTTIKEIFDFFLSTGEMIVRSVANGFRVLFENLLAQDDSRIYKAEFGDTGEYLSSSNKGFCVNGTESLTLKDSFQNCMVIGATGTGKGAFIVVPSIIKMIGSTIVIHDPSGENVKLTSGLFAKEQYRVAIINPSEPERSDSYNPIDYVRTEADTNKLASLLIKTTLTSNHSDQFWNLQATSLLKMFISIVLTQEKQYRNLANVRYLLNVFAGEPKKIDRLFAKSADDELMATYKSYVAMDNKLISSLIATVNAALQLFSDPDVCRSTSISTIDFDKIRNEKTVIYVQNSTTDARYYAPLISIFFEQLMKSLLSHLPGKEELPVFLLIDEAATLMTLPTLTLALTNCRKYRVGILTAWQSQEQITHAYGSFEADTIRNNSLCQIFLPGQGLQTTSELEKILGRTEIEDEKGNVKVKPLLLSEEIRTMRDTEALIIMGNRKPLKVSLTPYFEQPFMRRKTNYTPLRCENIHITNVPLIPLE